jgi:hypothetical protein
MENQGEVKGSQDRPAGVTIWEVSWISFFSGRRKHKVPPLRKGVGGFGLYGGYCNFQTGEPLAN